MKARGTSLIGVKKRWRRSSASTCRKNAATGHLRDRPQVQNIDLMNLADFCRNCLSNWLKDAADARGLALSKEQSREAVYGMPYDEWKSLHQKEASPEQQAAFAGRQPQH
ncbi:DUF1244 domain-containing protein [Hansschlegelia beijingensis]